MGKSSKKNAKAERRKETVATAAAPTAPITTAKASGTSLDAIQTLLGAAQAHVDQLDFEAARSVYQQVVLSSPQCIEAIDGLSDACLQMGDREQAVDALMRSIELQPTGGIERYMNLGQLCEGAEALSWLERGVAQLRMQHTTAIGVASTSCDAGSAVEATHALACGLCSVAEVFLTDACDEPDAETRSEAAAMEALELVRPFNPQTLIEPYVTLSSVRLSQERPGEAKPLLAAALAIIAAADEAALPPFDARLSCAKLLMEVGNACEGADESSSSAASSGELAAEAFELLQALRLENEDSLEVWYLTCCAALLAGEPAMAHEEATAACAFAQSEACPAEEREWLPQLLEVLDDAGAACEQAGEGVPCDES